jgi:hypothetical protein
MTTFNNPKSDLMDGHNVYEGDLAINKVKN